MFKDAKIIMSDFEEDLTDLHKFLRTIPVESLIEAYRAPSTDQLLAVNGIMVKMPPLFDGSTSWFRCEELIDDWQDITQLEAGRRGPAALMNRLFVGEASLHKGLLDRESPRAEDGVKYFKDTLRPLLIKGAQSVFLWRSFQFNRARRENNEMVKWIGKFSLLLKHLRDAWMYLLPTSSATSEQMTTHERLFPFSDNLTTLMFIASDPSEAQRERLVSALSLQTMDVNAYPFKAVRKVFVKLFFTPKISMKTSSIRVNRYGSHASRTFIVELFIED